MKILVTGASGFLGSHVAEQLSKQGHAVRALVRRSSNKKFLQTLANVELAEGSVEDAERVAEAVKGVDAIVHSAGLVKARSEAEFHLTNVKGTENLVVAAKAHAPGLKRFVFVSSLAVAGPSMDGVPVHASREPMPVTHYGRSKLAAERIVLAAKGELPVVVLRPAAIYGPRDAEVFAFFQSITRGLLPTVGLKTSTMSVIYGADCADACIKAITADVPSGAIFFVDDGRPLLLNEMLEEIERALGKKALLRLHLPMPVVWAAATASELFGRVTNKAVMLTRDKMNEIRQPHWVCSSEETRRALDWEPRVGLAEGTKLTAQWYRENGWL